jgi:hypothetical protein
MAEQLIALTLASQAVKFHRVKACGPSGSQTLKLARTRRGSSTTEDLRDVIHRSDRLGIEISPGDSGPAEAVAVQESMGGLQRTARAPIALPLSAGAWWLVATVLFSLLLYYFVGIDQGAASVFGRDMHIHELMHDGRHFASFPCH